MGNGSRAILTTGAPMNMRRHSDRDGAGHRTATAYGVAQGLNGDTGEYEATTVTDPLGHQRATLADGQGRETYDARYTGTAAPYTLYASTQYSYDLLGDLTEILPPNGVGPVTDTYDVAGRKTAMSDPDRGNESYAYDADGNLTATSDARGPQGTVYAGYDGLDRLAWRGVNANGTSPTVSYTYDRTAGGNKGAGRLTGESFTGGPGSPLSGAYAYTYDSRGRSTQVTTTVGTSQYTATKSYDDASEVTSQTYPDGETVTTAYQGPQWFGGVSTSLGGGITLAGTVGYSASDAGGPAGLITSMQLGGGVYNYADHYDLLKRRVSTLLTRTSDGATAYYQSRTFDANNNLTAETTDLQGLSDNQAFCYDDQSRLTWATSQTATGPCGAGNTAGTNTAAAYTQPFSYDVLGRLTTGPLGNYTYGSGAHVHAATAVGSTWTGAYDAAGNLTCRAPTGATTCTGTPTGQALGYDAEGRLAGWQNTPSSPTSTASYLYDGEGNRVEAVTTSGGTSTSTVYLGNTEEVATSGSTTTTTTYYYAGSLRIALAVNGVISYLATDLLGSSSVALSASGSTTAAQLYAPYGGVRYASGTMPTDYGFTGQHTDASTTGLDYYVSRYYDPVVGQFISPDSTLSQNGYNPWGLSRYAYVQGNPETLADPDGHCRPLCTMIVGALIGAAVGAGISIVTQVASGQSINWGEVGTQAAVGAVSGAIAGLAGPEAGPLGGLAAHALIGAASGMAGQLVNNAMTHKPLGDGVLMAGLIGGATVGLGEGVGGPLLSKLLGKAAGEAAGVAEDAERGIAREAGGEVEDAAAGEAAGVGEVCGLSFAASTPVATPTGEKPIASLKVGDHVVAYDPRTGKTTTQTVEHVWINHDTDLLDVTVRVGVEKAQTKPANKAHGRPARGARALVAQLALGLLAVVAALVAPVPALAAPLHALRSLPVDVPAAMEHIEVIHTTANHPWLTADRGWVVAGQLRLGEPMRRADGTTAEVMALHVVPGAGTMWDLTLDQVHTFAVGVGGYVVHNNNCGPKAKGLLSAMRKAGADVRHMTVGVGRADDGSLLVSLNQRIAEAGESDLTDTSAQTMRDILARPGWARQGMRYVGPDTLAPEGTLSRDLFHAEDYLLAAGADPDSIEVSLSSGSCDRCLGRMGLT